MRLLTAAFLAASILQARDTLSAFGKQWQVENAADWKMDATAQTLELVTHRGPLPGPRRPIQFAIAQTPPYTTVNVELDVRPKQKSLMLVFSYRDPAHFDYAHLSVDTAAKQPHHNGVFHVYGGERVRISSEEGRAAFPESGRWYHVILRWDGKKGEVNVSVDGQPIPALHAVDLSLSSGRIGLGSFDETADFKNVKIQGTE